MSVDEALAELVSSVKDYRMFVTVTGPQWEHIQSRQNLAVLAYEKAVMERQAKGQVVSDE